MGIYGGGVIEEQKTDSVHPCQTNQQLDHPMEYLVVPIGCAGPSTTELESG